MKPFVSLPACSMLLCLSLTGCAGMSRAMEYGSSPVMSQQMPDDTYRIFDKPTEGRLMITPSIGAGMARGAVTGGTFGLVQPATNLPAFEAAALAYLGKTGRTCQITSREELVKPQWEFKYSCGSAA